MPAIELIVGPPGCAKTTTLLNILEKEIEQGTPVSRIAYCSFTQMGSNVGRDRARARFEGTDEDYRYFRTLHSLCFRAMEFTRADVMSPSDYNKLSKALDMRFIGHYTREMMGADDIYLFVDQLERNNPAAAYEYYEEINMDKLRYVRKNYPRYKEFYQKLDFTDMLELYVKNRDPLHDVDVAFIDEAQDLTTLQWRVALLAFREAKRIYIAGDDDQAIFQWAGADTKFFQGLAPNAKLTVLNQSWRLPRSVHAYATRITDLINERLPKDFYPTGEEGMVATVNSLEEVNFSKEGTHLVLARNNIFLDQAEQVLKKKGVVYSREGKKSAAKSVLRKIERYEAGETKGDPEIKPDILDDTPWYDAFTWDLDEIEYLKKVRNSKDMEGERIRLSTMHGIKGGEADHVVLFLDMTRRSYRGLREDPDAELRVYYVAATRAKKTLTLVMPNGQYAYPNMLNNVVRKETVKVKRRKI